MKKRLLALAGSALIVTSFVAVAGQAVTNAKEFNVYVYNHTPARFFLARGVQSHTPLTILHEFAPANSYKPVLLGVATEVQHGAEISFYMHPMGERIKPVNTPVVWYSVSPTSENVMIDPNVVTIGGKQYSVQAKSEWKNGKDTLYVRIGS